ncbi:CheR family methyltransferase [Allosediminivita pacifica]|uniref:Chemotaxis protein methyltransferase n=1 Tax=Allosediminivita pacifica TaxID=1267769 RepID=A0A2T6A6N3_9RHOB|nr:protein-glutamate O-methyltransferase [Allosediminivita pacifica]PTX39445.1 chemotaxis protein methyltransferase CheR [Allosediminivita pacifica]GGB27594.1 chemotaxis protein methyltransferase [Allosediminivita pacifica]
MTTAPDKVASEAAGFSDAEFRQLAALARSEFGLSLAESKKPLVFSRLSKRLKARNVDGFSAYLKLLTQPGEDAEKLELISALTTNVTSFFRESHHFHTLREELMPELSKTARAGGRVRLWSSACSSGQEAYSIAMTVLDCLPEASKLNVRILATDIDPAIVRRAREGRYHADELAGIPEGFRRKWTRASGPDHFEMIEEAKDLITFGELNLISPWPFHGPFDAIFCRNVAIYFDQETQQGLWKALTEKLRQEGILFIGHSERVSGPAAGILSTAGVTSYRKCQGAAATGKN